MYAVTFALKTHGEFPIWQDLKEFAHFTALGANLGALGSILEPLGAHLGGSGAVSGRSWPVLERSWRPSCGNVIFGRFLNRFWGRLGRPRGGQMEVKLDPKRTQTGPKSKTKKTMQKESLQDRLGELLEPSWSDLWAILAEVEAI